MVDKCGLIRIWTQSWAQHSSDTWMELLHTGGYEDLQKTLRIV